MFARYANNFLDTGVFSWDPGGGPTYGITSVLYLLLVAPLLVIFNDPGKTMAISSTLSGMAFLGFALVSVWLMAGGSKIRRMLVTAFVFMALAIGGDYLGFHFAGGMDTGFSMAFASAYLMVLFLALERSRAWLTVIAGVLGGLAYWARPDLMLYPVIVPVVVMIMGGARLRRTGAVMLAVTAAVLAAELIASAHLLGSALPLSYYVKSTRYYSESVYVFHSGKGLLQLANFAVAWWPFILVVASDLIFGRRELFKKERVFDNALLLASIAFIIYHAFFSLQIMYYGARFFYPALPALIFLSVRSLGRLGQRYGKTAMERAGKKIPLVPVLLLLMLLPVSVPLLKDMKTTWTKWESGHYERAFSRERYCARADRYWKGICGLAELPPDLVIATADVGMPGALNPGKKVIDLAGLNHTRFAKEGFSADVLFREERPDIIYMPRDFYEGIRAEITGHPAWSNYELLEKEEIESSLPVAVLKKSPYYERILALLRTDL